jgi:hypothetical protein
MRAGVPRTPSARISTAENRCASAICHIQGIRGSCIPPSSHATRRNVFELEISMRAGRQPPSAAAAAAACTSRCPGNHGPGKYDAQDLRYSTITGHYDSRSYKMATSKRIKKTVPALAGRLLQAARARLQPHCTTLSSLHRAGERIAPGPGAYHPETTSDLAWRVHGEAALAAAPEPQFHPPQALRTRRRPKVS